MTELTIAQKEAKIARQRQKAIDARDAAEACTLGGPVTCIILGVPLCLVIVGFLMIPFGVIWGIVRALNRPKLDAIAREEYIRWEDLCEQFGAVPEEL